MTFMDILNLILAFLTIYGLVYALRLFLPRKIVPRVSTSIIEAMELLENAEAISIPNVSDYRADLAILHNQFLQMRTESHRSPGFFQQLYLLFLCGLTLRLNDLESQIEAIKRQIELALDQRQLAILTGANAQNALAQSATTTALPRSATHSDIRMINVVEPTPPPRAVTSTRNAA